jgi:hypothetical protein
VKIIKQSVLEKLTKNQLLEQQRLYQDENKIIAKFDLKEYQNKISKVELLKEEIQEECDIIKKKAKKLSDNFFIKDSYYKENKFFIFSEISKVIRIKQVCCEDNKLNIIFLTEFEKSIKKIDIDNINSLYEYFTEKIKVFKKIYSVHDSKLDSSSENLEDIEDDKTEVVNLSIFDLENVFDKIFLPYTYELDALKKKISENYQKINSKDSSYYDALAQAARHSLPIIYEESLTTAKKIKYRAKGTLSEYFNSFVPWNEEDFKSYIAKKTSLSLVWFEQQRYVFYENDFAKKYNKNRDRFKKEFVISILNKDFLLQKFKVFTEFNDKILRKIELLLRSKAKQKEKLENVGYVYVLSNEAYPGVYKIGSTYGLVEERAEELTGTGHLHSFVPEFSIKIESAEYFEKTTHSLFKEYRVKQGREFFKMELKIIKMALKQIKTITNDGKIKFKTGELKKKIGL